MLGAAGVGKSRLAYEFLNGVEASVVRGRCLRSLLGETEQGTSAEEIAWAFRKLLEETLRAGY